MILAVIALLLLSIALGTVSIPFVDILRIFMGHEPPDMSHQLIVWQSRLPNALTAIIAGAGLSISGLLLQSLFRNPLAGPSVLGITSGASLGVAFVLLLAGGAAALPFWGIQMLSALAAIAGAMFILLILLLALRKINNNTTILILGLMLGYAVSSVVSILELFAGKEALQNYVFWGFGSFSGLTSLQLIIMAAVVLFGLLLALPLLKPMNALLLGEDYAASVGVGVSSVRNRIVLITGILAAIVTAFCGPVAFIGMAVPHLARWIFKTSDHRILFPSTLLLGMITALACDLIARLPGLDLVLPLNAVTALLGAPVVLIIILRNNKFKVSF
jgi:iron complex transport system permease protein